MVYVSRGRPYYLLAWPRRVIFVAREAPRVGRALKCAVNETRSASQKIKHLYSAEIFQRRLDSFLISFMAGRNITPDLPPPTAVHHHNHFVLALARAHHSRAAAALLSSSPRFAPLSLRAADHQRETSPRRWNELSGVRSTNVLRAARKHAICPRYSS